MVRKMAPTAFGAIRRLQRIARTKNLTESELEEELKKALKDDDFTLESGMQKLNIPKEEIESTLEIVKPAAPVAPTTAPNKIKPPGDTGANANQSVDYFFAGLVEAFKSMTLEIPLGDGTAEQIVGGVLKRKGVV